MWVGVYKLTCMCVEVNIRVQPYGGWGCNIPCTHVLLAVDIPFHANITTLCIASHHTGVFILYRSQHSTPTGA